MKASRLKLKLPSLKVVQRSTSGEVIQRTVPRGCTDPGEEQCISLSDDPIQEDGENPARIDVDDLASLPSNFTEPSIHEIVQKATTTSWNKIRSDLRKAVTESNAMPLHQCCKLCIIREATCRCLQCSSNAYFCTLCYKEAHSKAHFFHTGEVWENGVYRPIVMERVIDVRSQCECSSITYNSFTCITEYGEEHKVSFASCPCEPVVVTLARARLWPSSPQRPKIIFTFELMDWAEVLLLECQVALKDFCKALYLKCQHLVSKRKEIYSSLIDAFEEYRWMKVELRNLTFVCSELDNGNTCPACPKESGTVVLSMDALFGLPRKKAAGISFRDPLHGHLFFGNQSSVDEYVSANVCKKKLPKTCSSFLAGDSLRSSTRYHALDETALFGCACRHEFPYLFVNLKHGERLAYGVWLMDEISQRIPTNIKPFMMYDIACNLVKHLQANNRTYLLEQWKFALPSFHAYGHIATCQAEYSPLYCKGIGLSDGEVMERMWSYLRRYTRMTKEMRPAHRVDVLSHALLYYGHLTKQKLPSLLVMRWKKASEMNALAHQTFSALTNSLKVPATFNTIETWIDQEKAAMSVQQASTTEWRNSYFHVLQCYYALRDQLSNSDQRQRSVVWEKMLSMESQLVDMERKYHVVSRWKQSDKDYLDAKVAFFAENKKQLASCLWASVVRRHYLLKMKAKYADGQKIAKKLAAGIAKEVKKSRQFLEEYNATCCELDENYCHVEYKDILSVDSDFWGGPSSPMSDSVPWKLKKDIIQAYLLMHRSEEEMELLKVDMQATIAYWYGRFQCISKKIEEIPKDLNNDSFLRGVKCCLSKLRWEAELHHSKALLAFQEYN